MEPQSKLARYVELARRGAAADVDAIMQDLKDDIKSNLALDPTIPDFMKADFKALVDANFDETMDLIVDMSTDFSDEPDPPELAGKIPSPEDGLIYFEKITLP